jgi:sugar/nucleoside kinase (ribokinase family)
VRASARGFESLHLRFNTRSRGGYRVKKYISVVGEVHQDLYYETDFLEIISKSVASRILELLRYNPDDINRAILEKFIKKGISEIPKKVESYAYLKRGGNGNNTAEFISNLDIPTRLIAVLGTESEWMLSELNALGIDTGLIYKVNEKTPVSTIIKSNFTTKILLAPNMKKKMQFVEENLNMKILDDTKILYVTPIAEKNSKFIRNSNMNDVITVFNVEIQAIHEFGDLKALINNRKDLMFINIDNARALLHENLEIEKLDEKFRSFAYIRIYTAGKDGSFVFTDNFNFHHRVVNVEKARDLTGAGDCFAAGFLVKAYFLFNDREHLINLNEMKEANKLKEILIECIKYATYTSAYKISRQEAPSKEQLSQFIQLFERG